MTAIATQLHRLHEHIADACARCGRPKDAVQILAVSKTQPPAAIRAAYAAGQTAFGENYVQEALSKIAALSDLPVEWHFIGPIQSNKTMAIAKHFAWVHSLDRLKIAQRLSEQRPDALPALNVCIQVNVSGETQKSGLVPDQLMELAVAVAGLPRLRLRGLMTIPAVTPEPQQQRRPFAELRRCFDQLNQLGLKLDCLSMGMSQDFGAAICEGATCVRIGTAIFGARR